MASTLPTSPIEPRTIAIARLNAATPEQSKSKHLEPASPDGLAAGRQAETKAKFLPGKLVVEKDQQAGRFVQTVIDSQTLEVKRRYPSEAQLAFSRAVGAYMRAMAES